MQLLSANQEMVAYGDILQTAWDGIVASRFDLLMLAAGLASYMVLFSARNRSKAAWESKKRVQSKEELLDAPLDTTINNDQLNLAKRLDKHVAKHEHDEARGAIEEVLEMPTGTTLPFDLVISILGFCRISLQDRMTADDVLDHIGTLSVDVLIEFINFYIDTNQFRRACDVFEKNFAALCDEELGDDTEWALMHAALKCGRQSIANHLFETSQLNTAQHVTTIQRWWKRTASGTRKQFREQEVGAVFGRLARVFAERYPFEEDSFAGSDDESTVFLGDDDRHESDVDTDYDDWNSDH